MNFLFSNLLIFFYVYSVKFFFLPVGSRVLFGLCGILLLFFKFLNNPTNLSMKVNHLVYILFLIFISFIALSVMLINGTNDLEFIRYSVSMVIILFASYFVITLLNKIKLKINYYNLSTLIVNAIFIQSFFALSMFFLPEVKDFIVSIQNVTSDDIEKIANVDGFRILGFGTYFFGAGVISGFALILIGGLVRYFTFSKSQLALLSFKFLFIFIVGMMMSRTTLVGALISLAIILTPNILQIKTSKFLLIKRLYFLFSLCVLPLIISFIILTLFPKVFDLLLPIIEFALELFINYYEGNGLESDSTNHLLTMYVFPTSASTWFIGDGYWVELNGDRYYMNTDVGFLRLIFYFGVTGLLAFLSFQWHLINKSFEGVLKPLSGFIFLYLLVLNLKGFTDLTPLVILFSFSLIFKHKNRNSQF